jgi:hypothetical protein
MQQSIYELIFFLASNMDNQEEWKLSQVTNLVFTGTKGKLTSTLRNNLKP